jgi:hypothetical protein
MGCLLTNLLVLPGAGTFMAGQRGVGFFQAVPALVGFFLVILWLAQRVGAWLQTGAWTWGVNALLLTGIFLSVAAWTWSLVVGLRFLRQCRQTSPPPMDGGTHHG